MTSAGQTAIFGRTYRWQEAGKASTSDSAHYEPLRHVKITVVRYKSVIATAESGDDGSYKLVVESGAPINIVFYLSTKDVPEMQSLSAVSNETHQLSAALMTTEQHRALEQRYGVRSVGDIVHCILATVPKDSDAAEVLGKVD